MNTPRKIVFWRHGRTPWNAEQRFQGQTDIDLDDVGTGQALRAAGMLATLEPSMIIASDLLRARATAQPLARGSSASRYILTPDYARPLPVSGRG